MNFEWDEQKRLANLAKHAIDFVAAKLVFDSVTITLPDTRRDYGEPRFGVYGEVKGSSSLWFIPNAATNAGSSAQERQEAMKKNSTRLASPKAMKTMKDKTDWARVRAMTDSDIQQAVADDPDTFIPDDNWWAKARVVLPKNKEMVTLRLDPHVIEWFKHDGRGYQTRINAVLKAFVEAQEQRVR